MDKLFMTVFEMSLRGSIVIGAVLLARLLLRKAPAAVRFALWALVAVALLVPVRFKSDLSLMPAPSEKQTEAVVQTPQIQEETTLRDSDLYVVDETYVLLTQAPKEDGSISFRQFAQYIWAGGFGVMVLWAFVGWLRLRLRLRTAVRLRENVYICDHIPSPFVLGLFRAKICLPSDLPDEYRDYVLAHERGHIFRWDHLTRLLGWGVLAIHWWNPLVWLSFVLFCRDMEMACDEWVIRGLEKAEVRRYSEALIACSLPKGRLGIHLAFGEVGIKSRIKNILHYKKPTLWISLAAVAVAAVVAVCFLTERPPAEEPEEQPQTSWTDARAEALEEAEFGPVDVTQTENPGFTPPLELTGALSAQDSRALADFRDGTGYQFFADEAAELVRLLNALTAEDFVYEPELSAVMSVTLTASGRDVYLESDTDTVVLVHEGIRWGIRDGDLSRFFRMIYSVTDYEEQNVVPLQDVREHYSMEEAMIDQCVILEEGKLRYNAGVWDAFLSDCRAGKAAMVRIWEHSGENTWVWDLSFDGNVYCRYRYENDQLSTQRWAYLHCFSGDIGEGTRDRYHYDHYILSDDPDCTWDESTHTIHHSGEHNGENGNHHGVSKDGSHHRIFSGYTYYPKNPTLPDTLDKAELVLDGKVILATVVPESLARLETFFENAEETYEPKTYSLGPELVLWFREETLRIQLELNNDLCLIGGVFYDYGPGYTDEGSYNALPELLACFGIQSWPQPVVDKYGDYIWW